MNLVDSVFPAPLSPLHGEQGTTEHVGPPNQERGGAAHPIHVCVYTLDSQYNEGGGAAHLITCICTTKRSAHTTMKGVGLLISLYAPLNAWPTLL